MSRRAANERRVLDEAGGFGAMTWVMAIMLFLTVLAGALALGTAAAARLLDRELAGRLTVQVAGGEAAGARVAAALRAIPGIGVAPVDRGELARLLRPWLGSDGADPELPVPQLIDVTLNDAAADRIADVIHAADPAASVELHAGWMTAVGGLLRTLTWLGAGLVLLMASATAAVVVLAARAGLETHRATIEVMHMMGATDVQVARLFQRRVAIDAAIGGTLGAVAALAVTAAIGGRLAGLGSELIGGVALGTGDWLLLAALPLGFVALATLAARTAVLATLRRLP